MLKGYSGAFIAVGFFGILLWWFAAGTFYNIFLASGMASIMAGLITALPVLFFLGMLIYGFVADKNGGAS